MKGKDRCKILKDIRKRIADENDIEFITSECKHKGDCLGTCPKCESEVRYLEQELAKKRSIGKRVAISGIAAGITLAATGCTPDIVSMFKDDTLQGEPMPDIQGDMVAEYSRNDNSIPNESGVSEIVDGEIVEIIGEMPEYSGPTKGVLIGEPEPGALPLPEVSEISDPYLDIMGDVESFPLTFEEAIRMDYDEMMTELSNWTREYIDYEWREHITRRTENKTFLYTDDGRDVSIIYDDNGYVTEIFIPAEELMGDMSQ